MYFPGEKCLQLLNKSTNFHANSMAGMIIELKHNLHLFREYTMRVDAQWMCERICVCALEIKCIIHLGALYPTTPAVYKENNKDTKIYSKFEHATIAKSAIHRCK